MSQSARLHSVILLYYVLGSIGILPCLFALKSFGILRLCLFPFYLTTVYLCAFPTT